MKQPILRVRRLCAVGENRELLKDIWLDVYPGEVTGIIGLDLEGKTVLTEILTGERTAREGSFFLEGKKLKPDEIVRRMQKRVGYVGPKERLSGNLTIADNLFVIGHPMKKGIRGWMVDETEIRNKTTVFLKLAGIDADPSVKVADLDDDERHRLEVVSVLIREKPVIAFNSPLKRADFVDNQEKFIRLLNYARENGIGIVMMMSSLDNLMEYCDHAVIVRKGSTVCQVKRNRFERGRFLRLLDDRTDLFERSVRNAAEPSKSVLELREVKTPGGELQSFSLDVKAGEVVGLINRDDAWNGWFTDFLCGKHAWKQGEVLRNGKRTIQTQLMRVGTDKNRALVILADENLSLLPHMSAEDNVLLQIQKRMGTALHFPGEDVRRYIRNVLTETGAIIRTEDAFRPVDELTMEQKLCVWMARAEIFHPDLCILLGMQASLDAGTQQLLDQWILQLSGRGTGVLLIETQPTQMHHITNVIFHVREGVICKN